MYCTMDYNTIDYHIRTTTLEHLTFKTCMECKTGFSNKQRLVLLGFTPNRLTERHQVSVCLSYIWCSHVTCMEGAKAMMDY